LTGVDRVIAISKAHHPGKWKGDKRICNKCSIAKTLDSFNTYTRPNGSPGLSPSCTDCKRKSDRDYVKNLSEKKKERRLASSKEYRKTDKYKARVKEYIQRKRSAGS
jgi:hypothetical protein